MRHPEWILAVVIVAAFAAPLALEAQPAAQEVQDYAQREAGSVDLEDFTGGHHGVVLAIVLIAAVIVLIAVILPW